MERGALKKYFVGAFAKILSSVEVDCEVSNQHEFNGVNGLKSLFGPLRIQNMPARFLSLPDDEDERQSADGSLTWYDARKQHPKRSEFRLYFSSNDVLEKASAGDVMIIALRPKGDVLVIIAAKTSTSWQQLSWLFGIDLSFTKGFVPINFDKNDAQLLTLSANHILEQMDIEIAVEPDEWLPKLRAEFGEKLPSTVVFSEYARKTAQPVDPIKNPDEAMRVWVEHEEKLFRQFERHIVCDKLKVGFYHDGIVDVDGFIGYSLSIQNRRKSRAGHSLEHHLAQVFASNGLKFDRGKYTEGKSKPDFLFPGVKAYHDPSVSASSLAMLGSKSTCKDRWRQVLTEADKIEKKHVFTIEPAISKFQTDSMKSHKVQLVLPKSVHATFSIPQRDWLFSMEDFIKFVRSN